MALVLTEPLESLADMCAPLVLYQAALSAALLLSAYILQQRFSPFLVSSTLSSALDLNVTELETRLQQQREQNAAKRHSKRMGPTSSSTRRRSRALPVGLLALTSTTVHAKVWWKFRCSDPCQASAGFTCVDTFLAIPSSMALFSNTHDHDFPLCRSRTLSEHRMHLRAPMWMLPGLARIFLVSVTRLWN